MKMVTLHQFPVIAAPISIHHPIHFRDFTMPPRLQGIFALLCVTLVWGTTFPAVKQLSAYFPPVSIIFIRFLLAALLLSPFLWRSTRADWVGGGVLGLILFLCYLLQVEGLALTSANRNAFITGLNVLLVPLIGIAAGKLPERRIIAAIALAVMGLFALCWDGGAWSRGDTLAFGGSVLFAAYVYMLDRFSHKSSAPLRLTAVQILTVALCAGLWLAIDLPRAPAGIAIGAGGYLAYIGRGLALHADSLVYLGVVATAAIISLQTWGQRRTSANEAYFWIGETMSARAVCGAALLIGGMIVSQWQGRQPAAVPAAVALD